MIFGETADISIFRFAWYKPIWYCSPSQSFPHDNMEPGLHSDGADNTGDSFSYIIMPVQTYEEIPMRRPVTLVYGVVRSFNYSADYAPRWLSDDVGFKVFTNKGVAQVGEDELKYFDAQLKSIPNATTLEQYMVQCDVLQQLSDEHTLVSRFRSTIETMAIERSAPTSLPEHSHQVVQDLILHVPTVDLANIPGTGNDINNIPVISQTNAVVDDVDLDEDDSITMACHNIATNSNNAGYNNIFSQFSIIFDMYI